MGSPVAKGRGKARELKDDWHGMRRKRRVQRSLEREVRLNLLDLVNRHVRLCSL